MTPLYAIVHTYLLAQMIKLYSSLSSYKLLMCIQPSSIKMMNRICIICYLKFM